MSHLYSYTRKCSVRWDVDTLACYKNATSQHHNVSTSTQCKDGIYYECIFRRNRPTNVPSDVGILQKNALLYHIKLTRNLCNSILYTKYLEHHLYRVNYYFK